jgi:myo-inositol-1(or 4)-monophosphatase
MLGSAAIDLAWVADGKLDASVTLSNHPWDIAAGVIIAREAGARVVDIDGSDHGLHSANTIAATPGLIDEVRRIVQTG